jgi:hypothetical protein
MLEGVQDVSHLNWSAIPATFGGTAHELARLLRGEGIELLPALAILCQGFLAVTAGLAGDKVGDEVKQALDVMGWDAKRHTELVSGEEKRRAVEDPGWWLDTLELRDGMELNMERWLKFTENLQDEWGPSDGLENLDGFKASLKSQGTPSIEVVANGYLAIFRRLGGHRNTYKR